MRTEAEKKHWLKTQGECHKLFMDLIERSHLGQSEIAQKCGWYTKQGKPDQARVSSYTTFNKFSMPAYSWMALKVWDMSLPQFFAAASNEISLSLEQTDINRLMDDLTTDQNRALVETARSMQKTNLEVARLKQRVKNLKS